MSVPAPASMERFGLAPRPTADAPEGNCCFNGYQPVAEFWKAETRAEEAVAKATLAKLVETADKLKRTEEEAQAASDKHAKEALAARECVRGLEAPPGVQ